MTTPLLLILAIVVASAAVGIVAGRRGEMTLEKWSVGGRRFGVVLIWLLMAGEFYTTFTFLGASGWAYSRGAPAFYILIYGALGYIISFFVLPPLWRLAKARGLHTQPDFFLARYDSRTLAGLVAFVGVISMVPYLQLQLSGLGLIVETASAGAISSTVAIIVAFGLTVVFVYASGLKGVAWVAIIKDAMMIIAVLVIGFGLPSMYFGGIGPMLRELMRQHPGHLVLPGATKTMGLPWVISTVLLTGCGYYCWPHAFASAFSAKDDRTIRRNAVIMPLYQLPVLLVFFVGFTALLVMPGLKNPDGALLALVLKSYPPWFAGFVGAAGAVTAMVPSAVLLLAGATLMAKNVYRPLVGRELDDQHLMRATRVFLMVIAVVALVLAVWAPTEIVFLLIFGYDGITQFFPGVVLGLFTRRASALPVGLGLVTGEVVVVSLLWTKNDPVFGMNAGFVGLAANVAVVLVAMLVSSAVARQEAGRAQENA